MLYIWCKETTFGIALITNGTLSTQLEEMLSYGQIKHHCGNPKELMSCQRKCAQSLRSPSPAPSPG